MIVAMMTLLALAAPFCTFAQPDVSDKDGVMRQVVKIVMGWELATVGGNKIGAWQWVDTKGMCVTSVKNSRSPVPLNES